jgi:hypothetical protein
MVSRHRRLPVLDDGAPIANTIIINRSKLGEPQGLPQKKPKHQSIAEPFALLG